MAKRKEAELKFKSTKDIEVSKNIVDQVIGQDEAVEIIRKAAKQRRHVLLIGEPGTGKSMIGLALAELLPKEKLVDLLSFFNPNDENTPLIRSVSAGQGRDIIAKSRLQSMGMFKNQNILMFVFVVIAMFAPWWARSYYKSDIMFAAFFLGGMLFLAAFVIFINLGAKMKTKKESPPKLVVDNFKKKQAPFYDACLLPGQRVFTNSKPEKIENTENKIVYNQFGKKQKVVKVERKPYKGKIYHIKPRLLFPFTATPNHPFLVLERSYTKQFKRREFQRLIKRNLNLKWKRANQLVPGDMLIYPELDHPKNYCTITFENRKNAKTIKQKITLDEDVAKILGWYLAEGYCRNQKRRCEVGFVFGRHEQEEALQIKKLIENKFEVKVNIDKHLQQSFELRVYSKILSGWFEKEFGKGAKIKKIPKLIFSSPKNVKIAFLNAYIAGDGYQTPDGVSFATSSKDLAEDMIFLLSSLGIFPSSHERDLQPSEIKGRKIKGPHLFEFYLSGKQLQKIKRKQGVFQHYFSKDKLHFIPIRNIWTNEYKGDIINMETEDGTYLMPCITHNTGAHAGALLGDVLHDPFQSGGLGTPAHERIVAGMIHKANMGVLFIDEIATLHPATQQDLLTSLQEGKYSITGQSERSAGAMVRTEPVPCNFILVAAGNMETIKHMHPALRSRIRGYGYEIYMNETIKDNAENRNKIAQFVAQEVVKDRKIPHFSKTAVDTMIIEARRRANRKGHLTLRLRELGGLIRAAGDIAKSENSLLVEPDHIKKAKMLARTLEQQISDKIIERKKEYEVIVTEGKRVGRVNGLAVMGDGTSFSGIILPIESEVTYGGKEKEIIATGKLGEIAKEAVKNVSAIIMKYFGEDIKEKYDIYVQFLQTYEGVEGDSASIAVATSIISALKKIPVKQNTAMTGSLSVRGEVLPIGGVSYKIEAAIDTGLKRVIVPASNMQDIVVDKKRLAMIKIIPVRTISEVLKEALDWKGKQPILKKIIDMNGGG